MVDKSDKDTQSALTTLVNDGISYSTDDQILAYIA